MKKEHILKANEILSKLPKINLPKVPSIKIETPEVNFDIIEDAASTISISLTSWKLDVFNCIIAIEKQEFTLNEVYSFENKLQSIYPNNQNITESVQTEVDAGYEGRHQVVLIEAKNSTSKNTIIRQLYYPFRQWQQHTKKKVNIFFEKRKTAYSLWQFSFKDEMNYNSIELERSAKFEIINV